MRWTDGRTDAAVTAKRYCVHSVSLLLYSGLGLALSDRRKYYY